MSDDENEPSESGCLPAAILILIYAPLKWLLEMLPGSDDEPKE